MVVSAGADVRVRGELRQTLKIALRRRVDPIGVARPGGPHRRRRQMPAGGEDVAGVDVRPQPALGQRVDDLDVGSEHADAGGRRGGRTVADIVAAQDSRPTRCVPRAPSRATSRLNRPPSCCPSARPTGARSSLRIATLPTIGRPSNGTSNRAVAVSASAQVSTSRSIRSWSVPSLPKAPLAVTGPSEVAASSASDPWAFAGTSRASTVNRKRSIR